MHRDLKNRGGLLDLAGSTGPASLRTAAAEPVLLGDIAAVLISDLAVMRTSAPADRKEKEGLVLRFAARKSTALPPARER